MHAYWIEPFAPLVFRSGKPFGAGSRDGANFPWPSSFAGLMRTTHAQSTGIPDQYDVEALKQLAAAGPFLAKRRGLQTILYVPKPRDAVYLAGENDAKTAIYRLYPGDFPQDAGADLPDGLEPVIMEPEAPKGKPKKGPGFWPLSKMIAWRCQRPISYAELEDIDLLLSLRTHVALDRSTRAADPGRIFQTEGWSFGRRKVATGGFADDIWGLVGLFSRQIQGDAVCFGGERRLSWLEPIDKTAFMISDADCRVIEEAVHKSKRIAFTFVTPAAFSEGWRPAWANGQRDVPDLSGLRLRLCAATLDRWVGHSGWDLAFKKPRPARALVPAGATYWFEVLSMPEDAIRKLWLASVCDDPQDRLDGFGLVVPGI